MSKLEHITLSLALLAFATSATAQNTAPAQVNMQQQLQQLLGKKKNSESMGQALVVGMLLGCTNKKVGKETTQAFYQEMQTVGRTVEGYCKQGHATEARSLVLSTLETKKNEPVMQSALECYDAQSASIEGMGGKKMATDAAHYARWARDPAIANNEMKTTDICR